MLAHALLPHGIAVSVELHDGGGGAVSGLCSQGPSCDRTKFPAKHGLHGGAPGHKSTALRQNTRRSRLGSAGGGSPPLPPLRTPPCGSAHGPTWCSGPGVRGEYTELEEVYVGAGAIFRVETAATGDGSGARLPEAARTGGSSLCVHTIFINNAATCTCLHLYIAQARVF